MIDRSFELSRAREALDYLGEGPCPREGHHHHVTELDFVSVPAGPFAMGPDPARLYPPDEDETPRRVVRVEGFRIARLPVTDDDGVPLTYVSRHDAEAFCAANGVRLPTEVEWEAAARGGDDRLWPWGDELPDATRATFGQGIGGPSPAGLHPAGAAPCGALDLAGNVWEWTADGAARGGSYLSGPGELCCSARLPVHPAARDPYVGFRVVAVDAGGDFDWVEVPAGDYVIGRDPGETRQRHVDVDCVRARADARHERAVRALRRRDRSDRSAALARAVRPSRHVRRLARGVRVLRLGRRAAADRGRVGEGRPRHRRAHLSRGATTEDESRAAVGAGLKRGSTSPVGSHPDGASPYGLLDMAGNVWEWTSTEYPPGERVLRGGSFASPGLAWARARCAATAGRSGARRTSASGSREPPASESASGRPARRPDAVGISDRPVRALGAGSG